MLNTSANWINDITTPAREVKGKVELYTSSTLQDTFNSTDKLSNIKIEATPVNGEFFGYTLCRKATIEVLDKDNDTEIASGAVLKPYIGTASELVGYCDFFVTDAPRDEVRKVITVEAYDLMNEAQKHTQAELDITFPTSIMMYAEAIAAALGTTITWEIDTPDLYDAIFTDANQPNLEGTETFRELLGYIAQALGTICFIKNDNTICFKQLGTAAALPIGKSCYFELKVGAPVKISQITSATQLGDNITAGAEGGRNQILMDNPFLENNIDTPYILEQLLLYTNYNLYPYSIKWRANPALEIGDTVEVTLEDDTTVKIIYLGETIKYTGGLSATSEWQDKEQEKVDSNPSTIGEAIKQTYAKVDKVNKQIDLVVGEASATSETLAALQLNTESINASVSKIQEDTAAALEGVNDEVAELKTQVEANITSEDVTIAIKSEMANGVDKVTTATGFTFNEEGLRVSKDGSEISTIITDDGMKVFKNEEEMLIANNEGVKAKNLHATTYLIIGYNTRFEDYNNNTRTGCFWIGN